VAQAAAVPFLDKDVNMVVSFSTAVGKTVLAECAFAYHMKTDMKCRVVYVCPFRSLAAEKHKTWMGGALAEYGVVLGTGDTDAGLDEHMAARIAVVTTEAFDSKTRQERWKPWLNSMACAVFDEAHLMSDRGRGGALESSLMRFSALRPEARLMLLSATMSNAMAVAKWVKSLNGKPTKCVTCSWRPTEIRTEVIVAEGAEKVDKAVEMAAGFSDRKVIVFVHSKLVGADVKKRLRKMGIRTAFHNASLPQARRRKIEEAFNSRDFGLNVLVSTSTLGAGVNIG
jgi:helicase